MIQRKSLFDLHNSTLQVKLSESFITTKDLPKINEIKFYVSYADTTKYFIGFENGFFPGDDVLFKVSGENKYNYFVNTLKVDKSTTIDSIVYYIKNDLKDLYYKSIQDKTETYIVVTDTLKQNNKKLEQKNKDLFSENKSLLDRIAILTTKLNTIKSIA